MDVAPAVLRSIAMVLLVAMPLGCFAPQYGDGHLQCSTRSPPCPSGYYCAATATCWRDGHAPPRPPGHLAAAAGGAVRVSTGGSHAASLSIGEPLVGATGAPHDHTVQFGVIRSAVSH
jgi:hypothetical protein